MNDDMKTEDKDENSPWSPEGLNRNADRWKAIAKSSGIGTAAIFSSVAVSHAIHSYIMKKPPSPMEDKVKLGAEVIGGGFLVMTVLSVAIATFLRLKARQAAAAITPPGP